MPLLSAPTDQVSPQWVDRYEKDAGKYWELFYKRNQANFFKDRHYLEREFPDLATGTPTVLEVGCGVGNTVYPLLQLNQRATVYACDFSETAVSLVKANPQYDPQRLTAFVADVVSDSLCTKVPQHTVDFCTVVFVLSAIAPDKMPQAIRNIAQTLKPGSGRVLVRDYGTGDLAHARLAGAGKQQKLGPNFYVRGDGTRCCYFTEEMLRGLFEAEGFLCEDVHVHERSIENRLRQVSMERRWVQAVFTYTSRHRQPQAAQHSDVQGQSVQAAACNSCTADTQAGRTAEALPDAAHTDCRLKQDGCSTSAVSEHGSPSGLIADQDARALLLLRQQGRSPADTDPAAAPEIDADEGREWDEEPGEMGSMFQEAAELEEECIEVTASMRLKVRSLGREHRHLQWHTGLLVWEAALPLARFILACPALFHWKRALELGCGGGALCAVAAARSCRQVVASDGSPQALELLRANVMRNWQRFLVERLRVRLLSWGHPAHIQALQAEFPEKFDIVFGSDVVYVEQAVPLLFASAAALLSGWAGARVLLCHITRRVSEGRILAHAEAAGLVPAAWPPEMHNAARQAGLDKGPLRLLCFQRQS